MTDACLVTTIERLQQSTVNVKFDGNKKGFQGVVSEVSVERWRGNRNGRQETLDRLMEPEIALLFSHDDYTRLAGSSDSASIRAFEVVA